MHSRNKNKENIYLHCQFINLFVKLVINLVAIY